MVPESHPGIAFRGNIGQCHRSGRTCSDTGSADADRDPGGFPMHRAEVRSESGSGLGVRVRFRFRFKAWSQPEVALKT